MKSRGIVWLFAAALMFIACNNGKAGKPLQQEDTAALTKPQPEEIVTFLGEERELGDVTRQLYNELDSSAIYDDGVLQGYWFKPHEASDVNIFFHKANKFEIKYYVVDASDNVKNVYKTGTYKQVGDSVFLQSPDGWQLAVRYWHPWKDNDAFYITRDSGKDVELYLVKGSD